MATGQDPCVGAIQAHMTLFDEGHHLLVQGDALARIEIVFARGPHGAFEQMRDIEFHRLDSVGH